MIRFQRPPQPAGFGHGVARPGPKGPFDSRVWGAHKAAFSTSQHGKCGYCESYVAGTQDGDVEHYAPKAEVRDVHATAQGVEAQPGLARIKKGSRKTIPRSSTGYWWRAYDWTNYLFACAVCNQRYKGGVFPLDPPPPARWKPTRTDARHRPLLLNCYDEAAPWRHFQVDALTGTIIGVTADGRATIATCGLHRETLRVDRRRAVARARDLCDEIQAPATRAPVVGRDWKDLCDLGRDDAPFAGAVRAVAEVRLGLRWEEILAYVATLPAA